MLKLLLPIILLVLVAPFANAQNCPEADDQNHYVETVLNKKTGDGKLKVYYKTPFGFDANKPTLLIINGGPGGDHGIVHGYDALKNDFNLVGFDHRGLGCTKIISRRDSGYTAHIYEMAKSADDIDAIRKDLVGEDGKWFVYGISYGGMLAQKYAFKYQANIEGLILDSTFHRATAINVARHQYIDLFINHDPIIMNMFLSIINRYPDTKYPVLQQIFSDTYSFKGRTVRIKEFFEAILEAPSEEEAKKIYSSHSSQGPFWGMGTSIACEEIWDYPATSEADNYYFTIFTKSCKQFPKSILKSMDWSEDLKQLLVKTLIMAGGFDPVTPASVMAEMDALAPNSYLFTNAHTGHGSYFELKDCSVKLLKEFTISDSFAGVSKIAGSELCQKAPDTVEESIYIKWHERIGMKNSSF
jgi:pimeloyl-ACP methyl ester carboxylesterase